MSELAFFRHGEELLRVPLGDRTEIGRGGTCDVVLPDPAVSRVQAIVERREDGYHLIDRSGHGTRVAGEEVASALLREGADIALGGWRAVFRSPPPETDADTRGSGETAVRTAGEQPPLRPLRLRVRWNGQERIAPLSRDTLLIGKDPTCDLPLEDPFVSARHARLDRYGGRWYLTDLGSTNGTFVAGARVSHGEVLAGSTVALGDTELSLEPEGDVPGGEAKPAQPALFEGMLSRDAGMRQVFELVERVASADVAVTILGETGTGKELVARALHSRSGRRQGAFIPVNCSAIAEGLVESELFGHEKGAFSGADRLRKGAFEEADGGTLFLDEIGELPIDVQPKLLRALELGEVKRVGATRPIHVSTRIVAATHRDLRAQVRAGKFREDLFYRLSVVPLHLPPLRSRRGDVGQLAQLFLKQAAPRGLELCWSDEALSRLQEYDWPGNVRQLRNVVQRALLFRGEGRVLGLEAVVLDDPRDDAPPRAAEEEAIYTCGLSMEEIEREAIRLSLRRNGGKRSAVVRELRIAKSTVMKRINQWGMQAEGRTGAEPPEDDDSDE
jgi:DNA-binding NtrC family response regulator